MASTIKELTDKMNNHLAKAVALGLTVCPDDKSKAKNTVNIAVEILAAKQCQEEIWDLLPASAKV